MKRREATVLSPESICNPVSQISWESSEDLATQVTGLGVGFGFGSKYQTNRLVCRRTKLSYTHFINKNQGQVYPIISLVLTGEVRLVPQCLQ